MNVGVQGRPWHIGLVIGLMASLLSLLMTSAAHADDPDDTYTPDPESPIAGSTVSVESNDDGVTIYIGISDTSDGSSGDPSSDGGGTSGDYSTWTCTADVMNIGQALLNWFLEESAKHPGEAPWIVRCNDEFIGIVWIPTDADPADIEIVVGPGDPTDPLSVAAELRDHLPVPDMAISANPDTGLVALPSWFWIDGYDGAPISSSDTLGGVTVEVQIVPQRYTWSFGDGGTLETTFPGEPYPAESDIQHSYEQSSLGSGGAFAVTVEISFSAQYRVNGGAWQSLDAITRSFTGDYPVQQLQSVLTED